MSQKKKKRSLCLVDLCKNEGKNEMESSSKRHATAAQVTALMDFMQEHSDKAKGLVNSEAQWVDLTTSLNSMGGAVKSVDKWKQTWRDLKSNTKKRALKNQQSLCDTGGAMSSEGSGDTSQTMDGENCSPPKKRLASFDEEIIKIERDKLEFEKEYKIQKIEVLSRIATALEELAKKE